MPNGYKYMDPKILEEFLEVQAKLVASVTKLMVLALEVNENVSKVTQQISKLK